MFRRQPETDLTVVGDTVTLEGPDLEAILAEVARRCGDDAEILAADRTIVGGVGGFFGRESYVVRARRADGGTPAPDDHPRPSDVGTAAGDGGSDPVGDEQVDGASFAAALAEALARTGGPGGDDGTPLGLPPSDDPAAAPADRLAVRLEDLLSDVEGVAGAGSPQPDVGPSAAVEGVATWDGSPGPLSTGPIDVPAAAEDPDGAPADDGAAGAPAGTGTADRRGNGSRSVPGPVPLALPDLTLDELLGRLDDRVGVPVLPPGRGIVAVVGDADDALLTAQRLAGRSGRDADDCVVLMAPEARAGQLPWLVVTSPAAATDRRRRWARRSEATFVAVAVDPGPAGLEWAREALAALEPDQVRYAAPAWRCADELAPRVAAVGHVDVVDLVHLASAVEPGEFLDLVPPVGTLDGRPAEAGLWAAHLMAAPTPQVTMELLGGGDSRAGRAELARRRRREAAGTSGARP